MRVCYDKDQRRTAKEKGMGLVTVQTVNANGDKITYQGPATEQELQIVHDCRTALLAKGEQALRIARL
ncbi:hypothetical protein LCGC14_2179800 [marine sediment metagenome]|uniref:Uncharacterized protein n=1 Tax=marine sediment metagenome TaxID=412755 RepID=A0A0F9DMM6_9ZZZZ